MHEPKAMYASWTAMQMVENAYDTGFITRKVLAVWRLCFAPSCLSVEDYVWVPIHVK